MPFDFPSDRRAEKYPLIAMYDDTANDFINWLNEHKEIDRRVPPIYQDFRITHKSGAHEYSIFTHYNEDSTAFEFRMKMDGKTIIQGISDYSMYDGIMCMYPHMQAISTLRSGSGILRLPPHC